VCMRFEAVLVDGIAWIWIGFDLLECELLELVFVLPDSIVGEPGTLSLV